MARSKVVMAIRANRIRESGSDFVNQRRSVLLINQQLVRHDVWDEQKIDERGVDLAERILRTWPAPDSDVWSAIEEAEAAV
jgi:hypothetical protein